MSTLSERLKTLRTIAAESGAASGWDNRLWNGLVDAVQSAEQLEADNARLRDALRPFAAAYIDNWKPEGETKPLGILIDVGKGWDSCDSWWLLEFGPRLTSLTTDHLRAAHLALNPDDTGGEDDD